jgi:hypothetical protein
MKGKLVSVKEYHLSEDGVRIVFAMENQEPELVYEDKEGERKFSGRQIHLEHIQLGYMASVVLNEAPDSHTTTFSLAVPAANRPDEVKSIAVKTFAVRTTHRTSIGGPDLVEGQIQTYETYGLEGNAW